MIRVRIERKVADGSILAVYVDGHAEYAGTGKDIVCAGVSSITVGTVNSVKGLLGVILQHQMDKGLLHISVPEIAEDTKRHEVQLLLESMVVMLETIKNSYGKYIAIQEKRI